MKQVFSMLAFCLILGTSSGLMAQNSNTQRIEIPYRLATEIIQEAQPILWNDMFKTTPELIDFYNRGVLTIDFVSKGQYRVEVHGCLIYVLIEGY